MTQLKATIVTYPYTESTRELLIPFDYLRRDFIEVSLQGPKAGQLELDVNIDYRFSTKTTIDIIRPFSKDEGFDRINIRRVTDATRRLVSFQDGSILNANELNVSQLQALHIAEEARDLSSYGLVVDKDGNLDARGRRIVNLGSPVKGTDASDFKSVPISNPAEGSVKSFSSINQLRTYEPMNQGEVVYVASYHEDALKGGGYFYHDFTRDNDKENKATVIKTTGGKSWLRKDLKLTVYDCGCLEGIDSTLYIESMEKLDVDIEGLGAKLRVTKAIKPSKRIYNVAYVYEGISYVSPDYYLSNCTQITKTGYYSAWVQDKAFEYDNVLYAPFMSGFGHRFDDLRLLWVRSYDGGATWDTPTILLDVNENRKIGNHCFSMGVVNGRLFALIEERDISTKKLLATYSYSRPMTKSKRILGGASRSGNTVTIRYEGHGLFANDLVSISNSYISGLSGEYLVQSVIDANSFTVRTEQSGDVEAQSKYFFIGISFSQNKWKTQGLGQFQHLGVNATHVHSFTPVDTARFVAGVHWGDSSERVAGILNCEINWRAGNISFNVYKLDPITSKAAAEPCVNYYKGKLYISLRTQNNSTPSKFIRTDLTLSSVESFNLTNSIIHYTPMPFYIKEDVVYLFGTERAEGEWESSAPDNRYKMSNPRTMLIKFDLKDFGNPNKVSTTCVYQGIYNGEIVNSACGVGSVIYYDGSLLYLFGDEDGRNGHTYTENSKSANNPNVGDGLSPDIYCLKLQLNKQNKVLNHSDIRLTGVNNVNVPLYRGTDGVREFLSPIRFKDNIEATVIGSRNFLVNGTPSAKYGIFGGNISNVDRVYLSSTNKASAANGSLITLHNATSSSPNLIQIQGDKVNILGDTYLEKVRFNSKKVGQKPINTGDIVLTYVDNEKIKITMKGSDDRLRSITLVLSEEEEVQ